MFSRTAINFKENIFSLHSDLIKDLKDSKNPQFLLIVGPARSGKSTLSNMLIDPTIRPEKEIFKTDEGNDPVTFEIQYIVVKLSAITRSHQLPDPNVDCDLFLMDCEGIDSLGKVTLGLRKAICTLLQISTVNLFVTKNIDRTNIFQMRAFFTLPGLFPGSQRKLNKSIGVVLTDIGVPGKPTEEEFEQKRKANDRMELDKFYSKIKSHNLKFDKEHLALFAQPKWDRQEHYFESIKDLIRFIVKNIENRSKIPGEKLIEIFNDCVPIISENDDLDDPDIQLEKIVDNVVKKYLKKAFDATLELMTQLINENILNKSAEELIEQSKTKFIEPIENTVLESFEQKANEVFEDISSMFPDQYLQYKNDLREKVDQSAKETFQNQCKQLVIPYVSDQIITENQNEINSFFDNQTSESLRSVNIEDLLNKYPGEAGQSFYDQLKSVCEYLTSCEEYNKQLNNIQTTITNEINQKYQDKCQKCPPYPRDLEEARKAGQNGNEVIIFPINANGKCAQFQVTENDELTIKGMTCKLIIRETNNNLTDIVDQKVSSIKASIDIRNMVIKPDVEILQYRETSKSKVLHSRRYKHFTDILRITVPDPFCFTDGTQTYENGSYGQAVAVKPIAFIIS